jgi:hypothetical protein
LGDPLDAPVSAFLAADVEDSPGSSTDFVAGIVNIWLTVKITGPTQRFKSGSLMV